MKRIFLTALLGCVMTMQVFAIGGKCGEKVKWNFDKSTGVLTISGEGAMYDFDSYSGPKSPWEKNNEIKEVVVENGVTSIGDKSFSLCGELTKVTLPNSVETIGKMAFSGCGKLQNITLPNSLTSIGNFAFSNCSALSEIAIPSEITSIGHSVFNDCRHLHSVTLPASLTSIGENAFSGCRDLTSISLPYGISWIGKSAFGYSGLQEINLPNSLTSLGESAFGHTKLKSVVIPASMKNIDPMAFNECRNLAAIYVDANNPNYCDIEGVLFSKDMTSLCLYPCGGPTEYIVPSGTKTIGQAAFWGCSYLETIIMPNTVTKVNWRAFANCSKLSTVSLSANLEVIEVCAFSDCKSIEKIVIPYSVNEVKLSAFKGCKALKEFYYPSKLNLSKAGVPSTARCISYSTRKPPVEEKSFEQYASKKTPNTPVAQQLPLLSIMDGSIRFTDVSGNNRIDADEKCAINFKLRNNGKGSAQNCEARVKIKGNAPGVTIQNVKVPTLSPGQSCDIAIPIISNIGTQNGNVVLAIEVYEPNGFGIAPFEMTVATKAYEPPYLQVVDYNITSASGKIQKMEPFVLTYNVQNVKYGTAENVIIKLNLPSGVFVMDGRAETFFSSVKSGEVKSIQVTLAANNSYKNSEIPITIDVKEKHGRFAENKRLDIALNQTASSSINIAAKDEPQEERREIQKAMLTSEVDRNIPVTGAKNPNTFVLIIANEHYLQVAGVPYALNDGNIFREYCIKTLGISEKHIKYFADATGNQIKSGVNWLANLTEVFDNPQIIVYYAGHGVPDEASKSAYLLPVDGNGSDITTGYKLDDLYATLGNMPAAQITVFMDACFSGSKRQQGMLASARGVALKVKAGTPQGNMVVFSAATGDETAYPNNEQQHGLFTYYLLKKLQETKGDVALKDLGEYITKQVSQQSLIINDKRQTPTVTPSAAVGAEWQNWKLK
jgi:hypothetical protein